MKKLSFIVCLLALPMCIWADDTKTCIHPASGSGTQNVALGYTDNAHLFISKDKFADAVPGNVVRLFGWNTGEGNHKLELGQRIVGENPITLLPSGELRDVSLTDGHYDIFLTQDLLDTIKSGRDFRVYGEGITINVVDLVQPGKASSLHDDIGNTVWMGYFWVDSWSSIDLGKSIFEPYDDFSTIKAIRFYHEANRTEYIINIFKDAFGSDHKIAGSENGGMTVTKDYAERTLTDADRTALAECTRIFLQGDKQSGSAFNLTDVVLVPFPDAEVIEPNTTIPDTVRNLTIHQGGSVSNADDITVTGSITYIYDAAGDAGAKLGHWYTFCLPFEASNCYVEENGENFAIKAVYLTGEEEDDNEPEGTGYFYLQSFNGSGWDYIGNKGIPKKDTPYIIKFLNAIEDGGKGASLASYFTANRSIKFVGRAQTINGTNDATSGSASGDYSYHANKTLRNIELTHVYTLNVAENQFEYDYGSTSVIAPFECYIKATTPARALANPRFALRPRGSKEQTEIATAMDHIADSTAQTQKILYNGQVVIVRDNKMYNVLGQEL
jgi:hypothetical protein